MFLLFIVSMFGYVLVHRIFSEITIEFAVSSRSSHLMMLVFLLLFALVSFILRSSPFTLWFFIGILLISLNFFPTILRILMEMRLRVALIPLLDGVLLGVQTGKSFRMALHSSIECQQGWVRNQLRELHSLLLTNEQGHSLKSALLKDFMAELVEIDHSKTRCAEQVRALRRHLKIQEDFRRRSGQLTQQIKMQAIIVTLLYFGLVSFVITQFGWSKHRSLLFLSLIMFLTGLVWIFSAGRRMKWKI